MKFSKKGFTLAEVLITLVIIGVVAAITVPTMMNSKRNEELKAGLLKAQSTLAGALNLYYVKNGVRPLPSRVAGTSCQIFKKQILPYFKIAKDCGLGTEVGSCVKNTEVVYKTYNNSATLRHTYLDDGQFILNDAMNVFLEDCAYLFFTVDINGYKKKPNRAGYDLFSFQINNQGNMVPMGTKGTIYYSATNDYCSETSTSVDNGWGCTAKALSDPNYFKNLH